MINFFRSSSGKILILAISFILGGLVNINTPAFIERQQWAVFDFYQNLVTPPPISEKFVIILAGERSMREIGSWPWPRRLHAQLLDQLDAAKIVAIDIIFPEKSNPEDDQILAEAVARHGRIITSVILVPDAGSELTIPAMPYPELAEATNSFGLVNVYPEIDGIYRDYPLMWHLKDGSNLPSLPLSIYLNSQGVMPEINPFRQGYLLNLPSGPIYLDSKYNFKIHHQAENIPIYEYVDVLGGLVSPEVFKDAIVILGVNASGASDNFAIGSKEIIPGSVYIANAAATLFHGWVPTPAPIWSLFLTGALMALLGGLLGLWRKLSLSMAGLAFCILTFIILTWFIFIKASLWLPPLQPTILILIVYALTHGLKVRFLSVEWRVQQLSIEYLLFLGHHDLDPSRNTFPNYLRYHWNEIEKWSGVSLLTPFAPGSDPEIASALAALPNHSQKQGLNINASIITATSGINRLLITLPESEKGETNYSVLGWSGRKSPEILKSVVALILAVAMHFMALDERQARADLFLGVIRLIMGAVDAKDPTTAGHSERVASLAKELASKAGLSEKEIEDIYLGGLLHDVGKLGIPDQILNKPGRLDDTEMDIMKRHPVIGLDLMSQIKLPEIILKAITEHHERLDGKGYPYNIPGHKLSKVGRILKIADVYDALVSKRQYKEPMTLEVAYKILKDGMGNEFDPELTKLILENPFDLLHHPHQITSNDKSEKKKTE